MQTLKQFLENKIGFDNWVIPSIDKLKQEFKVEQTLKGNDFFESEEEFLQAVRDGKILELSAEEDSKIGYRSHTRSKESILSLIKSYRSYPEFRNEKTLDALYDGFRDGQKMELPIVLEFHSGRRRIFSGNTRLDVAFQIGIKPKILLVKVPKKE